jgi:DNA-3-methyladenine glycosylase
MNEKTARIAPLGRTALPVDAIELARYLIGKCLVHDMPEGRISGRIVETEAYPVGDSTGHAFIGRRHYNESLFLAPGHAYVRLTYGVSYMLNVSAEEADIGAGVLLRAVEPLEGIAHMQARRPGIKLRDLARGPGRLTLAFGVGPSLNGVDLCTGKGLWLGTMAGAKAVRVAATTRIGLSREMHRPLRFYEPDSPFVSGPRKLLMSGGLAVDIESKK